MRRPKLLFVDDEPEILELLTLFFLDCETKTALNTDAALSLIHENLFDAMITDIKMPGASGLTLIDQVKAVLPDLPIIVINGHHQEAPESQRAKVLHWIRKPFRREAIRRAVLEAVPNH